MILLNSLIDVNVSEKDELRVFMGQSDSATKYKVHDFEQSCIVPALYLRLESTKT